MDDESKGPSILDLFARAVRDQMRDEQVCSRDVNDNISQSTRRAEMADWFRNLYVPSSEADLYIKAFMEEGFDSLEALSMVPEEAVRRVIPKCGHQRTVLRALPSLASLTAFPREECAWQWDDEICDTSSNPHTHTPSSICMSSSPSATSHHDADDSDTSSDNNNPLTSAQNDSFHDYPTDITRRIETARLTRQRDIIVFAGHNQKYRIDLSRAKQVNMRTGYKREIRRLPPLDKQTNPPNSMLCPIGLNVMNDPVMAADGHSYERVTNSTHKLTNESIDQFTALTN
eukprot:c10117_g1_i1.p1 GENE.c10117_g1_i1~~c10117_g1_i1.p1  ORF type:complete len:287 (+),score=42.98 c10117_g1_i1:256-1116(+)